MSNLIESSAEYISTTFSDGDFAHGKFQSIEFDACTFVNCDFSETVFEKCRFIDCEFEKCNLSLAKLNYSRFSDVVFKNSKIIGVDWTKVAWPNISVASPIQFFHCIINDSSFFGLSLTEIILEECKAHDVDFREGDFREGVFDYTDFTNSLFSNTNLTSASFAESANYDIDINVNKIKNAKFSRHEAIRLLASLDIELLD